jgi:hypothetical protein
MHPHPNPLPEYREREKCATATDNEYLTLNKRYRPKHMPTLCEALTAGR